MFSWTNKLKHFCLTSLKTPWSKSWNCSMWAWGNCVSVASWLEVPPRRADGAVGHRWGLPPADGGHPQRDRQLCPPLLLRPCKKLHIWLLLLFCTLSRCIYFYKCKSFWNRCSCSVVFEFCIRLPSHSIHGWDTLPATLLDKWPQTLPQLSKRNFTRR